MNQQLNRIPQIYIIIYNQNHKFPLHIHFLEIKRFDYPLDNMLVLNLLMGL